MKSEDKVFDLNSNESVLNNQFSAGNLKLNVNVRVKYNPTNLEEDAKSIDNDELTIEKKLTKRSISNDTKSLYDEINSLNEATDDQSKTDQTMNESSFLKSFTSSIQSSKSFSSTPIKKPTTECVDRAIAKSNHDDYSRTARQSLEALLDDSINEPYEFLSFSSDSSLMSDNSTASKNSQSTEQLYGCDEDTMKSPVVQVCVRVRPMNTFESKNPLIKKIVDVDELNSTLNFKDRRNVNDVRYRFKFNHLFHSKYNKTLEDNQQEIFTKIGQPYLQNLLEGNDLCYFAYGQTGSGKSYTIMGDESTEGLVFRFARQLFEIVELNKRTDLEQLFCKSLVHVNLTNSKNQTTATKETTNDLDRNINLLAAKKQLYDASQKYGFTDVINGYSPNNSFENEDCQVIEQCSTDKCKDKILRFNENIECYKDDSIYHEKLLNASESEMSSMDSFKNLEHRCELQYNSIDKQNLSILKNILTKYGNQSDNLKIDFSFKISFYEIYSESIYDLLEPNEERIKSKVREHPTSGPYIVNLTMKEINSMKELEHCYELGNKRRSKSSTHLNEKSSRSHAVFNIYITQTHHYQATLIRTSSQPLKSTRTSQIHSKISFVDLAGSERASTNDPLNDERLKEGNSINKSLLTLGKVITKLAWINKCIKKKKAELDLAKNSTNPIFYVPYRDSVLTWLLKDCFNGKCKTFMIATISPSSNHYDQTLSTLRYAYKASKIKVSFKFNQIPINQLIREKSTTGDSKKLYIEHMGSLKDKVAIDNVKNFNTYSYDTVERVVTEQRIEPKSESKNESKSELKSESKNEQINIDHISGSQVIDDQITDEIDTISNISSKLSTKYESRLIEKIRELFQDYL